MRFPLTLLLCAALMAGSAIAAPRPNIVFIYPDDMRWDAIGALQREQGDRARFPWLQTPNFDRLLAQSVRFRESFVATSLCSPGRANVMTAQYGHRNGVTDNFTPLPAGAVTFAQHLRAAGYTTAYVGKWHMFNQRERPHYDFVASFVGQGRFRDCPILLNGVETPTQGWVDEVSTDHATRFIREQPKDKPFFLWLGFKSPHVPRGGENLPPPYRNLYEHDVSRPSPNTSLPAIYHRNGVGQTAASRADRSDMERRAPVDRDYFRHITWIDACVGRVLDALDETGRAGDTIVVLTSDNGYYLGDHRLGDKRTAYDESLRVPLLVRLPGGKSRREVDALVVNVDYGPTFLDFAGAAPLPQAHGRSLRAWLEGGRPADWRTAIWYEYFEEPQYDVPGCLALRTTTHKLIKYPGHDAWTEVFDLRSDPYETRNLAGDAALRQELEARFDAEARALGFRWPAGYGPGGEVPPPKPGTEHMGNRAKKKRG